MIREALKKNDFQRAKELLGHSYFLEGQAVKDQGLGAKLGFATINLKLPKNLVLNNGVYAAVAQIETKKYPAVVNLGHRPTIESNSEINSGVKTLEAHILDEKFKGTNKTLRVFFKSFLRSETKFNNLRDLSLQVQKDILDCKVFFDL